MLHYLLLSMNCVVFLHGNDFYEKHISAPIPKMKLQTINIRNIRTSQLKPLSCLVS